MTLSFTGDSEHKMFTLRTTNAVRFKQTRRTGVLPMHRRHRPKAENRHHYDIRYVQPIKFSNWTSTAE